MTMKNNVELRKIKYAVQDVMNGSEQIKQCIESIEELEENSVKFRYTYEESSVDIRSWTVQSDTPMSDELVAEICIEHMHEGEGTVVNEDTFSVQYHGTEYGDDSGGEVFCIKDGSK